MRGLHFKEFFMAFTTRGAAYLRTLRYDYCTPIQHCAAKPYIDLIKSRQKPVEVRINSTFYQKMEVGKLLCLHNQNLGKWVICKITRKTEYPTFIKMLRAEGLKKVLPFARTEEDGLKIYQNFPGAERVYKHGCVAIGLDPISSGQGPLRINKRTRRPKYHLHKRSNTQRTTSSTSKITGTKRKQSSTKPVEKKIKHDSPEKGKSKEKPKEEKK
jgi:ASC-1-like (ASCH) protein